MVISKEVYSWSYRGLECTIRVSPTFGCYLGYVLLPKGHPLYGVFYNCDSLSHIEVHGGLTFSGHLHEDDLQWALGFDCGHDGDWTSFMYLPGDKKWTLEEVIAETQKLADRLDDPLAK